MSAMFLIFILLGFHSFAKTCNEALMPIEDQSRAWQTERQKFNIQLKPCMTLRMATVNLNLINGIFVRNPIYNANKAKVLNGLQSYLESADAPDILAAQEIWEAVDHQAILKIAEEAGFEPAVIDPIQMIQTGLQILVKKSIQISAAQSEFKAFLSAKNKGVRSSWEKIGRKQRGVLITEIKLKTGATLRIKNTHLTPLNCHGKTREQQIWALKEMGERQTQSTFEVLLGDLNIAAQGVEKDRAPYQSLYSKLGMIDTFRAVTDEFGSTVNRSFPQTAALRWGKLIDRRIDYILVDKDSPMNIQIEQSKVIFNNLLKPAISDHYGVETTFQIF